MNVLHLHRSQRVVEVTAMRAALKAVGIDPEEVPTLTSVQIDGLFFPEARIMRIQSPKKRITTMQKDRKTETQNWKFIKTEKKRGTYLCADVRILCLFLGFLVSFSFTVSSYVF